MPSKLVHNCNKHSEHSPNSNTLNLEICLAPVSPIGQSASYEMTQLELDVLFRITAWVELQL